MSIPLALFLASIAALFAWSFMFGGRLPKAYHERTCQGRSWRKAFPAASKDEIREFLALFVCAFAYANREKLKLAPSDEVLKIYRAQYPNRFMADALEIETLALDLERRHGLKLDAVWKDSLTLGELFAHACPQAAGRAVDRRLVKV